LKEKKVEYGVSMSEDTAYGPSPEKQQIMRERLSRIMLAFGYPRSLLIKATKISTNTLYPFIAGKNIGWLPYTKLAAFVEEKERRNKQ
jgi:hypothetical protein